jgi:hypothetical protein
MPYIRMVVWSDTLLFFVFLHKSTHFVLLYTISVALTYTKSVGYSRIPRARLVVLPYPVRTTLPCKLSGVTGL